MFARAIHRLPAKPHKPTLLLQGLHKIEPVLQGLSGKTVVFIFSDGTYSKFAGMKTPEEKAKELAEKYNVCFYLVSTAKTQRAAKFLEDMAAVNECSRVVPFASFIERPDYFVGALYGVKATVEVETITKTKVVGIINDDILFDFNRANTRAEFNSELDELGEFMQNNPSAYTVLAGYADSIGPEEYNLGLSRRRAESVAMYLINNFDIDPFRIVLHWYGETNPVAGNSTAAGRSKNRRVESAVGGLD
jgi:OOP family OmpA-OmpF porin